MKLRSPSICFMSMLIFSVLLILLSCIKCLLTIPSGCPSSVDARAVAGMLVGLTPAMLLARPLLPGLAT